MPYPIQTGHTLFSRQQQVSDVGQQRVIPRVSVPAAVKEVYTVRIEVDVGLWQKLSLSQIRKEESESPPRRQTWHMAWHKEARRCLRMTGCRLGCGGIGGWRSLRL